MLLPHQRDNPENRVRHRIQRWQFPDPIGHVTRRALRRLQSAFSLVTPRVAAVLFRTLFNGWCTARRFQEEGSCILGCSGEAQDSIEHYSRCPVQVRFATEYLKIPICFTGAPQAFMCLDKGLDESLFTMLLLNLYATYTCRNLLKHHVDPARSRDKCTCMLQIVKQGVFGHRASRSVLDRYISDGFAASDGQRAPRQTPRQAPDRWVESGAPSSAIAMRFVQGPNLQTVNSARGDC